MKQHETKEIIIKYGTRMVVIKNLGNEEIHGTFGGRL